VSNNQLKLLDIQNRVRDNDHMTATTPMTKAEAQEGFNAADAVYRAAIENAAATTATGIHLQMIGDHLTQLLQIRNGYGELVLFGKLK